MNGTKPGPLRSLATAITIAVAISYSLGAAGAEIDHRARYRECMDLVGKDPDKAFSTATAWRDIGGGDAAEHCTASALIGLEIYEHGARRLEVLAETVLADAAMKAGLLSQASQAWLLAGNAVRAEAAATTALALTPDDAGLLIDRAQAKAARKDLPGAVEDLNRTLRLDPTSADALVFRAAAKRYLDDFEGAMADAERALVIDPRHLEGLFERGILKRLSGDDAGARDDWLAVLRLDPDSPAAENARANLEKMDVKAD